MVGAYASGPPRELGGPWFESSCDRPENVPRTANGHQAADRTLTGAGCVQAAARRARAAHVELVVVPDAGHLVEFTAVEKVATHLSRAATLRPHVTDEGQAERTPSAH